jgi:oligopeptide transport system substrate-binding protein
VTPRRLAAAALCLVLLAACTGSDPVPQASGSPTALPSSSGTPSALPIFRESDEVLTVAIQEPSTLDPMRLRDPGGVMVARQIFEGLTKWDPVEEEVLPAAAESWTVSDGGRTFTFKLRAGMTFHDGTPVTSRDFAFGFDRIAAKANASDLAYTLGDVQGFVEVNQLGRGRHLSGVRTPDPLTLVIRLSEPFYDFPAVLTHPSLVPVPARAVADQDAFLRVPVGNGPFHIAEAWSPGDPVLLKAFLGFYDTPEIDGVRFVTYPDAAASWLPFINGDIDVTEVPAGEVGSARETFGEAGFKPFLATYSYGLNVDSPQLDDLRLRRAVNKAIDRETIVRTAYRGTMVPARGILPIGMPGFIENICVDTCEFDREAARRLVSNMPRKARRVTLEFSGEQPHVQVARMVRKDLEAVGLKVAIRSYPFGRYLKRLRAKDHSMYRLGWIAEYPTPDAYLTPLFRSASTDNHSGFGSSRVDDLLRRARSTRSEGKRIQLYVEAEKAVMDTLPIVPIGSFVTHWAAQPGVEGFVFDQLGGFDMLGISLTED